MKEKIKRKISFLTFLSFFFFCYSTLYCKENNNVLILENFEGLDISKPLPYGWSKKGDSSSYKLINENNNIYLAGDYDCKKLGKKKGTILFKEYKIDYEDYPFLSWKWRVRQFPTGADEKFSEKGDSAVAVYIYIRAGVFTRKIIKFIWSEKYLGGTYFISPNSVWAWETNIYVLRGSESKDLIGQWVNEKINLGEIFSKVYSKELKNTVKGFGVITDADDTCSIAAGDYDDFVMTRQ